MRCREGSRFRRERPLDPNEHPGHGRDVRAVSRLSAVDSHRAHGTRHNARDRRDTAARRGNASYPRRPANGGTSERDETLDVIRAQGASTPLRAELVGNRRTALLVLFATTALLLSSPARERDELAHLVRSGRGRASSRYAPSSAPRAYVSCGSSSPKAYVAACGAVAGIVVASFVLRVLRTLMPAQLAGVAPVQLDLRVRWRSPRCSPSSPESCSGYGLHSARHEDRRRHDQG